MWPSRHNHRKTFSKKTVFDLGALVFVIADRSRVIQQQLDDKDRRPKFKDLIFFGSGDLAFSVQVLDCTTEPTQNPRYGTCLRSQISSDLRSQNRIATKASLCLSEIRAVGNLKFQIQDSKSRLRTKLKALSSQLRCWLTNFTVKPRD